jgi:hypothetical protein
MKTPENKAGLAARRFFVNLIADHIKRLAITPTTELEARLAELVDGPKSVNVSAEIEAIEMLLGIPVSNPADLTVIPQ